MTKANRSSGKPAAKPPQPNQIRFRVDPQGIPREKVARRLGLSVTGFNAIEKELYEQGFPRPDPIIGNWHLDAIDAWRDARSGLSRAGLTPSNEPLNAQEVSGEGLRRLRDG